MTPDQIDKRVEQLVTWITWFAGRWRSSNWAKRFTLLAVLWLVATGPALSLAHNLADWVWWVYASVALGLFAAALVAAVRVKPDAAPAPAPQTPALKWLNAYGPQDAELFRQLQRDQIREACLAFLRADHLRLGILSGESGSGKTSFLQAGLGPTLKAGGQPCLLVKLTSSPPLASFLQAVGQAEFAPDELKAKVRARKKLATALSTLVSGLDAADGLKCSAANPLVVVFDQFEQLFSLSDAVRREFVRDLADWYQSGSEVPVKVLISIRDDRVGKLTPIQQEVRYTLEPMNNLRLEKFSPDGAAQAFVALVGAAGIEADVAFVKDELIPALSDREDGRVSPVDLQVLAWVVAQQPEVGLRKFTRAAYQRLGGFEGLLEKYLGDVIGGRESREQRETAVAVLAALCDFETYQRAGAWTLPELQAKVKHPSAAVEEAVRWLASPGVRLITPVTRGEDEAFEVVHEKLIPAVQRQAHGVLGDLARADALLGRRVNEWLGNNRDARYLFSRREYRLIRKHVPQLSWGRNREAKEELLKASRRRFRRTASLWAGGVALALLVALSSMEAAVFSQAKRTADDLAEAVEKGSPIWVLRSVNLRDFPTRYLWVVRDRLKALSESPVQGRTTACVLLAELGFDLTEAEWNLLAEWMLEVQQAEEILTAIQVIDHQRERLDKIAAYIEHKLAAGPDKADRNRQARLEANAVFILGLCGRAERLWSCLRQWPVQDPRLRTILVHQLRQLDVARTPFWNRIEAASVAAERRALLLALGSLRVTRPPEDWGASGRRKLLGWYKSDYDPGVHGAVWWLLCRWDGEEGRKLLADIDAAAPWDPTGARGWFGSKPEGGGHTLTVVNLQGGRSVGVGVREVTVTQFKAFLKRFPRPGYTPPQEDNIPMVEVSWYDAARYCQWLSELEKLSETDWCFPASNSHEWEAAALRRDGLKMRANYLDRKGYRLPTRDEWEAACRAGASQATPYSFGDLPELLGEYAWYVNNAKGKPHPVGVKMPNEFGLFDMHGNAQEWCHDSFEGQDREENGSILVSFISPRVVKGGAFLYTEDALRLDRQASQLAGANSSTLGFRIARTLHP
jgi:formylglycine-generating enzyme required for sulfatase activity